MTEVSAASPWGDDTCKASEPLVAEAVEGEVVSATAVAVPVPADSASITAAQGNFDAGFEASGQPVVSGSFQPPPPRMVRVQGEPYLLIVLNKNSLVIILPKEK
jgi:hypothetical protein